ncbi:hypothetical protein AB0G49_14180 [Streptomyces longwoodensis]|uniref:hypothetical protein n=1 Tax=Streptomyces longwoodensis TaxID=68231 RepID=UPI0033FFEF9F
MTTEPRRLVHPSVELHARVSTLLAEHFPEHAPGRDGFGIGSSDHTEPRRMFVRWYGDLEQPEDRLSAALRKRPVLASVLERAGYVVTMPPGCFDVFFADRPRDDDGPRYEAVRSGLPFGSSWLVMDRWTRVEAAAVDSEEQARAEAARLDRVQVLADARQATAAYLLPYLAHADELLGDGMVLLYQTVRRFTEYSAPVQRERLEALIDVANALRDGETVIRAGRLVEYETAEAHVRDGRVARCRVRWVPKADRPALGFFPDWERSEEQDAAIAVLVAAGLTPVQYGAEVDALGRMCEAPGFLVSARTVSDRWVDGYHVAPVGHSATAQQKRVPEVMRAAGWTVDDAQDWPDTWTVRPPVA